MNKINPNPENQDDLKDVVPEDLTQINKDGGVGDPPVDPGNSEEVKPPENYETKFKQSSSEANRLRDIAIANGIDPKTGKKVVDDTVDLENVRNNVTLNDKSDEELGKDIPGFEFLSESEKSTILTAKQKGGQIEELTKLVSKIVDKDEFRLQLAKLVAQPEFVSLAGDLAFKAFAYKTENLQTSLPTLARAYLFDKKTVIEDVPEDIGNENRDGLDTAGGHDKNPPSDKGKLTVEQIAHIRTNDPKRYMQLIKSGKIRSNLR